MGMKKWLIAFGVGIFVIGGALVYSFGSPSDAEQLSQEIEQQLREDSGAFENIEPLNVSPSMEVSTALSATTTPTSTPTATVGSVDNGTAVAETESAMVSTAPENAAPPKAQVPDDGARAATLVAGGCFWCVEADLEKLPGVLTAVSGYAGGETESPTYKDYDDGGHREVVYVVYNPSVVSFREIIIYTIKHMDPTDGDGSFGDRGYGYSPALYYRNSEERAVIHDVIADINALGVYEKPLAVAVEEYPTFWTAEDYHQNYYKGTLSALKYQYYRNASGRDDFIDKHWGDDTGPTLPTEESPYDVRSWQEFEKPADEALQTMLTPMQYKVTQKNGTEPSFNNVYWDNHAEGIYVDIVSGEPLFSSTDKFDSGTGWPSFTKPIYPAAVTEHDDYKLVLKRTEIRSAFADSHLGHVFNDAPPELGGIRYCMNSASLRFVPKEEMADEGYEQFLSLF